MKKTGICFVCALMVSVMLLVAMIPSWSAADTNKSLTEINIRLKYLWYAGWAGELVADEHKIFEKYGLKAHIRPGGFELDPIKLVAAGTDDIGVAGADQILMARAKGIPLVAFAVQYQESPIGFALRAGKASQALFFKGAKVGVKFGTDIDPVYRAILSQYGLSKNDIQEIPVKFDISPFLAGVVDIYPGYMTNDLLLIREKRPDTVIFLAKDRGISVYGNVYFCTEKYYMDNKDALRRTFSALKDGWMEAFSLDNIDIAEMALKKNSALNKEHESIVISTLRSFILPGAERFGEMKIEKWSDLHTLLRNNGVLKQDVDYSKAFVTDIVDPR
ncbi:MAG: ABC transporter substrate-binding protein [Desulfobulbaceae bacterium]|nr:ABC transporter substrate-binding protein [Desulfobulbaceae bacterium]